MLKSVEHKMVELKARVLDLRAVREKLQELGARPVRTFHQIDTYFEIPIGRLKLRETEGENTAQLVYYERKNITGPKGSKIFILQICEPAVFKTALKRIVKTKVTVDKMREILRFKNVSIEKFYGIQVHLDNVQDLGTFIEFEKKVYVSGYRKDEKVFGELMKKLGVTPESLEKLSYSDLILLP
jgi:adenylate cyclase class 2